jgi:CarD family transcriptional regulator
LRWKGSACYPAYLVIQTPLREGGFVTFRKGDTVVHPEHGAAVIEEVRVKEFLGEKRKYLVLRVVYGDLTVLVPIDSTEQVGLRPCVSKNEAKKVLKVLTEEESSVAANWSRRFKNNLEKLHSGDPYEVAEVLRNLAIRDREKGLSAGEKRMITKARQILISELSFATEKSEDEAEALIDGILDDSHGVKASVAQV